MSKRKPKEGGVTYVPLSSNSKLGHCAATYVAQDSCPRDCPFFNKGCYAEKGHTVFTTRAVNEGGAGLPPLEIAQNEAEAIRRGAVVPGLPLRLHVVGDASTPTAAETLATAAKDYQSRGGGSVFTYTHAWQTVPRESWGDAVSVLASVHSEEDIWEAKKQGYAPAMVFASYPNGSRSFQTGGVGFIPCPNDFGKSKVKEWKKAKRKAEKEGLEPPPEPPKPKTCAECKLCMGADRIFEKGMGIAFLKK